MMLGFAFITVGYAVFYWGLHHFCVDCPGKNACACRYSLVDCLGLSSLGFPKGQPVKFKA